MWRACGLYTAREESRKAVYCIYTYTYIAEEVDHFVERMRRTLISAAIYICYIHCHRAFPELLASFSTVTPFPCVCMCVHK